MALDLDYTKRTFDSWYGGPAPARTNDVSAAIRSAGSSRTPGMAFEPYGSRAREVPSITDAKRYEALVSKRGGQADESVWLSNAAKDAMSSASFSALFPAAAGLVRAKAPASTSGGFLGKAASFGPNVAFHPARSAKTVWGYVRSAASKVGDVAKKPFAANAERNLKVAKKALKEAKANYKNLDKFGDTSTVGKSIGAEHARDRVIKELEGKVAELSEAARRYSGKGVSAKATSPAGTGSVTAALPGAPEKFTAESLMRGASRKMYGGDTPLRGAVRKWMADFPTAHAKTYNSLGWSALASEAVLTAWGSAHLFADGPKADPNAGKDVSEAAGSVESKWNPVTNSVNMASAFSDGAALRKMLSDAAEARKYHEYVYTNPESPFVKKHGVDADQAKLAGLTYANAVEAVRGSPGWKGALEEANSDEVRGAWALDRATNNAGGYFEDNKRRAFDEFDAMSDEQKIMLVPVKRGER